MKRIIALGSALVLALALNVTVFAANSPGAGDIAGSGSVTTEDVVNNATSTPAATAAPDAGLATATQQFSAATMDEFAKTTTIISNNATATAVSVDVAKEAIAHAKNVAGADAFVAAIFDLNANGQGGTFKVGCPNVWAGQNVTVLHKLANGSWEAVKPDKVENNAVTFTLSSTSPIAFVIDVTAAPKTADPVVGVAAMAVISLAGAFVARKKED
ncbi:MAG: hypothetical protein IJX63_13680 [Lachnospiraceae bacterium]|nr:hypothetical protein [Lachnospiraceae bacterium]